ncbi:MAG: LamG-like jellyroll fold domain-containing protein, partial [Bacteroidota bacterium]
MANMLSVKAQINGDYQTISSGNWTTVALWERYNGSAWLPATTFPTSADQNIHIRGSNNITVSSALTIDQTTVDANGNLILTGGPLTVLDGAGSDLNVLGAIDCTSPSAHLFVNNLATVDGTVLLSYAGINLTNKGSINLTTTLNGTSAQTINSTSLNSVGFIVLNINNGFGVTLSNGSIGVTSLNFVVGNIITGGNSVSIAAGGTITGGGTNGYVIGGMQRNFNAGTSTLSYPVGSASFYSPVDVTLNGVATTAQIFIRNFGTDHPDIGSSDLVPDSTVNSYWDFDDNGVYATADLTFHWDPAQVDGGANTANFSVAQYYSDSPTWTNLPSSNAQPTSITTTGITTFTDMGYAVGQVSAIPATTGDYRTTGNGQWNSPGTWQTYNGTSWIPASTPPDDQNANVIKIRSGHSVTVSSYSIDADQFIIESDAALYLSEASLTIHDGAGLDFRCFGSLPLGTASLIIDGTASFENGSDIELQGFGHIGGSGILDVLPGTIFSISGSSNNGFDDDITINSYTDCDFSSSTLTYSGGNINFNNYGTFNISNQGTITDGGTTSANFNNKTGGNIHSDQGGDAIFEVNLVNEGVITIVSGSLFVNNNPPMYGGVFEIETGATLSSSIGITFTGSSIDNNGFITTGLTMQGSAPQTINGDGEINTFIMQNPNGVTCTGVQSVVVGGVQLFDGKLFINGDRFVVGDNVGVFNASASSYVVGRLERYASGSFPLNYDIGDVDSYNPIIITPNIVTAGGIVASTEAGDHQEVATSGIDGNKSLNRVWHLEDNGAVFLNFSIAFNWIAADVDPATNPLNFVVSKYDAPTWELLSTSAQTATYCEAFYPGPTMSDFQIGEPNPPAAHKYRSASNGDWVIPATWEEFDGNSWVPAGRIPNETDDSVTIRSPHIINLNQFNTQYTIDQLTIESGATLEILSPLVIANGAGTDLSIDGSLVIIGGTLSGQGTTVVNSTGEIRVGNATSTGGHLSGSITNNGIIIFESADPTCCQDVTYSMSGASITNNGDFRIIGRDGININTINNGSITNTPTGTINNYFDTGNSPSRQTDFNLDYLENNGIVTNNSPGAAFNITSGSTSTHTGQFVNIGDGYMSFATSGITTYSSGVTIASDNGAIQFKNGQHDFNSSFSAKILGIDPTATLNGGTMNFTGEYFSNNGTFNFTDLVLAGTTVQNIASTSAIPKLTIDNLNGVALLGDFNVTNELAFVNGKLTTSSNKIVIGGNGIVTGASSNKYVIGNLQRNFDLSGTKTYDIGDDIVYTPVDLTVSINTSGGGIAVRTDEGDHFNIINSDIDGSKSVNRYWTLTPGGLSFSTVSATFNWNAGDVDLNANTANFIVGQYDDGFWTSPTASNQTPTSITASGMTALGNFQVGEQVITTPGAALNFDGVDDQVAISANDSLDLANKSFTVEMWLKRNSTNTYDVAFSQGTSGADNLLLHIGFSSDNEFIFNFWGAPNDLEVPITNDANWHHWACTFDNVTKQKKIYRDSVLIGQNVAPSSFIGNASLTTIGTTSAYAGDEYDGSIDELRVWTRTLTAQEISNNMNCEISSQAGLAASYHFNQANAGVANPPDFTVFDATGNGNDGELNNFALNGSTSNWVAPGGVVTGASCPPCIVSIPDANFKSALLGNLAINTNSDTEIQCSEAATYSGLIDVNGLNIYDLTGIEAFVNITALTCYNNHLSTLDVSANTALTNLDCASNNLTGLDVTTATGLAYLDCSNNTISSLNVTGLLALATIQCPINQLTSLDVSSNTALAALGCQGNLITSLDLSLNTALTSLACHSNQLTSLNIKNGNNANLAGFAANANQLTCIEVDDVAYMNTNWSSAKDASAVYSINCGCIVNIPDANFKTALLANALINTNSDGEIQCTEAAAYTGSIDVQSLSIADLTGIEAFTGVTGLYCQNNQLTSLDLSFNTNLIQLSCESNQLTSLNIDNCTSLTQVFCNLNQITSLNLVTNTSLYELYCQFNLINSFDLSQNPNLGILFCLGNGITNLDVSANPNLIVLNFGSNQISSIDLSANTNLYSLSCQSNLLTSLDLSTNTALTGLYCLNNPLLSSLNIQNGNNSNLTFFDVTSSPALSCIQVDDTSYMNTNWSGGKDAGATYSTNCSCTVNIPDANFKNALLANALINTNSDGEIQCYEAASYTGTIFVFNLNISDLTGIEAFTAITVLNCSSNQLSAIDLTANTALTSLVSSANPLMTLDVSQNTALQYLSCDGNQLTTLDVSNNTGLIGLWCYNNTLTTLNVSANTSLQYLDCSNNQFTTLDLSANTALVDINCSNTQLSSLNIQNGNNINLTAFDATNNSLLSCIQVDDVANMNANWSTGKDPGAFFNLNCPCLSADAPVIPISSLTICGGNNITISIDEQNSNLNDNTTWVWYGSSCATGSPGGSGASIVVNPIATITYYVRGEGGCAAPGACASITINIAQEICGNGIDDNCDGQIDEGCCNIQLTYASTNSCIESPAGTIDLSVANATAPVNYSWSNATTTEDLTQIPAGTYDVTVTDNNGCTSSISVSISEIQCVTPIIDPTGTGTTTSSSGSELIGIYNNPPSSGDTTASQIVTVNDDGYVFIDVIPDVNYYDSVLATIQTINYGMIDPITDDTTLIITGFYPIVNIPLLDTLHAHGLLNFSRNAIPAILNSGLFNTGGDLAQRSDTARKIFNLTGQGIKIGVLSDSYNKISGNPALQDVNNGDLPGSGSNSSPVSILKEYPYGRVSDEGRAMLQILHDVAPKASLEFRTGFVSPADFSDGIRELASSGCNIIVDDITYAVEPFFQDGIISQAITDVTAQGVSYFTAAGNFGARSYSGVFSPGGAINKVH